MNTTMTKIIGVILTTIILVASFGNLKSFAAGKTCSFWEELTEGDEYMKCPLPEDYKFKGLTAKEAGEFIQLIIDYQGLDVAVMVANEVFTDGQCPVWETYKYDAKINTGYYLAQKVWGKIYRTETFGTHF